MGATYFQECGPICFGMYQICGMSPSAVNFQFESQFELPDTAGHYVFRQSMWGCRFYFDQVKALNANMVSEPALTPALVAADVVRV